MSMEDYLSIDHNSPTRDDEVKTKRCPECKGMGYLVLSDCCGAEGQSNGDGCTEDYGICPDCDNYCIYIEEKCENCDGKGVIIIDDQDLWEAEGERQYQADKEDKANQINP